MTRALSKIFAIGVFVWLLYMGSDRTRQCVSEVMGLARRTATLMEIQLIDRLLTVHLMPVERRVPIVLEQFCRENLSKKGRDTSLDQWKSPYRLFVTPNYLCRPRDSVMLCGADTDAFLVVSACEDGIFVTQDDVISKGVGSQVAKDFLECVQAHARQGPQGDRDSFRR